MVNLRGMPDEIEDHRDKVAVELTVAMNGSLRKEESVHQLAP